MKRKQFSVQMDEELVKILDEVATIYGTSRSRIIELLIKEVFKNEEDSERS